MSAKIYATLVHQDVLSYYYHYVFCPSVSIFNLIVTGFNLYRDATCCVTRRHLLPLSNRPKMFGTASRQRRAQEGSGVRMIGYRRQ